MPINRQLRLTNLPSIALLRLTEFRPIKLVTLIQQRRDRMSSLLSALLSGLGCRWSLPEAGMFFWIRVGDGGGDTWRLVMDRAKRKGVLLMPGRVFAVKVGGLCACTPQYWLGSA